MLHLLSIEFKKVQKYKTFWILIGLLFLMMILVFLGVQGFIDEIVENSKTDSPVALPELGLYSFPDIWHNMTFLAGYFRPILGIVMIILISNEFHNKTIRHNIINGLSRKDFYLAKVYMMLSIAVVFVLLLFLSGGVLGITNTVDPTFAGFAEKLHFVGGFLLETVFYLFFVLFLSLLLKRAGLSIGLLIIYTYIIEPIIVYKLPENLKSLMPLQAIGDIIQLPNTQLMRLFNFEFSETLYFSQIGIAAVWALVFAFVSYRLVTRRDL